MRDLSLRATTLATIVGSAGLSSGQEVGERVGDFYPDLELPTIERGAALRLSAFRGRRVLLIEFASW
jgi:hypothetical protein